MTPDYDVRKVFVHSLGLKKLVVSGKYGLRVYDVYQPNEASVFKNYFLWRNANSGWTGTILGKVGFDGFVSAENGMNIFEGRATTISSWDECFIKNSLFIDQTGFHLGYSLTANHEFVYNYATVMGGPCCEDGGILLPMNEVAGGGMRIANCTWVNFKNPCMRYLLSPLLVIASVPKPHSHSPRALPHSFSTPHYSLYVNPPFTQSLTHPFSFSLPKQSSFTVISPFNSSDLFVHTPANTPFFSSTVSPPHPSPCSFLSTWSPIHITQSLTPLLLRITPLPPAMGFRLPPPLQFPSSLSPNFLLRLPHSSSIQRRAVFFI